MLMKFKDDNFIIININYTSRASEKTDNTCNNKDKITKGKEICKEMNNKNRSIRMND